jgi:hypothetical protein
MIIRGLDENGDWVFGKGKNSYKTAQSAIMQDIKTKLLEWKGDCFFSQNSGIDWINRFDKNQESNLEEEIRTLLIQCYGVVGVENVSVSLVDRVFSAQYTITTIFSQTIQDSINL